MKKCPNCGAEFSDEVGFCVKCGTPVQYVQPMQNNFQQPYMAPPAQNPKSNTMLIVLITFLSVLLVGGGVLIFLLLNKDSDDPKPSSDTPVAEAEATPGADSGDDGQTADTQTTTDAAADLTTYQEYYDSVGDRFGKLILSATETGEYTAYLEGLGTALGEKNADACKTNYDKLVEMEGKLQDSSAEKVEKLKKKVKKLKKSSYAKSTKKSVSFVKAETKAKVAYKSSDYKTADKYYKSCVKKLNAGIKKAKKKKKKKKKTNDTRYITTGADDYTYSYVCNTWFDSYDISGLSYEDRRYYINTLFAAYGYRFKNKTIQAFFDRQSWYYPDYSIDVGDQTRVLRDFSDTAKHNYEMLKG